MTPIGRHPNLILYGVLEDKGIETLPFIQWVMMAAPIAGVIFVVISFVLSYELGGKNLEQVEVTGALEPQQKN
jgi:sodium-dependent dicarboxylate transporter 2/3/5